MSFNVLKFYKDYRIDHAISGHKRCRPGWVQTHCPFCVGSRGYHLGVHVASGAVKCWRCGKHSQIDVIKALLGCNYNAAKDVQREFKGSSRTQARNDSIASPVRVKIRRETKWPLGTIELTEKHRKYLEGRKYDADELIRIWNLRAVGPIGPYKWRIIAPIYFEDKMVSYQGRDITDKSSLKYKACEKCNEVIEHQTIVYGYDEAEGDTGLLVEGIADVWRLGPGAMCCFGISFTLAQVNLLAKKFKKLYIMFDGGEATARKQSELLAALLSARGVEIEILDLDEGDPGEMPQQEADDLMKELELW
jgi:hypothetical protein